MSTRSADLKLEQLQQMMRGNGVTQLLVKKLAPNDNSKNQFYLGGSIKVANILPIGEIRTEETDDGNKALKAPLSFYWLQPEGNAVRAPGAQIILYPQYPEVRISGFLRGTTQAPNHLLNVRTDGRLLFLGITNDRRIISWAVGPKSQLAQDIHALGTLEEIGVFHVVPLSRFESGVSTREQLLSELKRIHLLDWIRSKALNADGTQKECNSSHCVGYTLESELGVPRNGRSEPDYKGWEIKAGIVKNFNAPPASKAITLMTPEPTGGFYRTEGVTAFIRRFGYVDKLGRSDRINFGGIYRAGQRNAGTKLTLKLDGFDSNKGQIQKPDGTLSLITDRGLVAAEWSFATLMNLWNRKHAQAVYVPAQVRESPSLQYRYGSKVRLAVGTDFEKLLGAVARGNVYYDPGIKLEAASSKSPKSKRRSQFRISSKELACLYSKMEAISLI